MTPRRWLLVASSVALIYAGQLVSAYAMDGTVLPVQILLAALVVAGLILAGLCNVAAYFARTTDANAKYVLEGVLAANAEASTASAADRAQIMDLLRRLGHVEFRLSCRVDALADQAARFDQNWAEFKAAHPLDPPALAPGGTPDSLAPAVDPDVIDIGRRVTRRLSGDEGVRH